MEEVADQAGRVIKSTNNRNSSVGQEVELRQSVASRGRTLIERPPLKEFDVDASN